MKSRIASIRSTAGVDRVSCALQSLEEEWQRHGEVRLEEFWTEQRSSGSGDSEDDVNVLAELVKADLRRRFEQGQTPTTAGYLELFPELRAADSRVLSLVYEEYCLNEERGTAPDVESFCDRYPDWKSSLISQLRYHRLFSEAAGRGPSLPPFPEAGQDFEEFRLQSLLGKGGMSRVFLARDLSLGGKQVVLKVTTDRGQEPQVQGPLDHPHIVPVNSVVYQRDGQLCGLSMPYRPGLILDDVIARVDPASRPRKAISLWNALVSAKSSRSAAPEVDGAEANSLESARVMGPRGDSWEGFPVRGTYAQGVAWIVMIYARALHYAHRMHTFHRDVKPGNLLLTIQSGPQLLDFNLAESPHAANHAQAALHGGTLPYMAPEQIEAFLNPDLWGKVGARADIYSLGLVLRELLTGQKPELPDPALTPARALRAVLDRRPFLDVAFRRFNPAIPHALQAVAARCLAFSPDDRYADARQLEQDLDRFLRRQPLKLAGNPDPRERAVNWVVRNRRALASAAGAIVLSLALYGLWNVRPVNVPARRPIEASSVFQGALHDIKNGAFDRAIGPLLKLEKDDPCPLVMFYLSLALNENAKSRWEADECLRKAFAAPHAERELIAWSKQHKEVASYLIAFAESRIKRADEYAERIDNGNIPNDEERDREYREPTYVLAGNALKLAEKLDTSSRLIQFLLAKTERMIGEYAQAYKRLSTVISSLKADEKPDPALLISCRRMRTWVAFLWAEQQLRDRRPPPNDDTLSRLQTATDDDIKCWSRHLENNRVDDHIRQEYHFRHDRLRAMLTLAEVEVDLSRRSDGRSSLQRAKMMLKPLNDYIESHRRLKVPPTDDFVKRIKDLHDRLTGHPNRDVVSYR